MPYKDLAKKKAFDDARRNRKNAQKRAARAALGAKTREPLEFHGIYKPYNPGPFKHKPVEVKIPAPASAPLSWIDRAQVQAYGYTGALKPNHF